MESVSLILSQRLFESHTRSFVVNTAVKVEHSVNILLSRIIGIAVPEHSKSFGSTSMALTFIAKINLLADLDIIKQEQREKLEIFATIRNKFAHLMEAVTFSSAVPIATIHRLKKLYAHYPSGKLDDELTYLFKELYNDIATLLIKLDKQVDAKEHSLKYFETYNSLQMDVFEEMVELLGASAIPKELENRLNFIKEIALQQRELQRIAAVLSSNDQTKQ